MIANPQILLEDAGRGFEHIYEMFLKVQILLPT